MADKILKQNAFKGKNISKKNLSHKILIGMNFSETICECVDFRFSDLSFATFKGTNLYHADFEGAILYCTVFEDCNLTRANFNRSYIYGVKFKSYVNVTYCTFKDIKTEDKRRIGYNENLNNHYYKKLSCGGFLNAHELGDYFSCNGIYLHLVQREKYDKEREMSQIYNRLKRIYKENFFNKEAANCYYLERYWHRKSFCKQDLSGQIINNRFSRFHHTICAYLAESICGYGERPLRVILWILFGWIIFALYFMFGFYETPSTISNDIIHRVQQSLYISLCNMISVSCNIQLTKGSLLLTLMENVYGIVFFAIFTATLIRKMIRD